MKILFFTPLTIILFSKEAGLGPYWKHFDKFGSKCISNEFAEFACHHQLLLDETNFGEEKQLFKSAINSSEVTVFQKGFKHLTFLKIFSSVVKWYL